MLVRLPEICDRLTLIAQIGINLAGLVEHPGVIRLDGEHAPDLFESFITLAQFRIEMAEPNARPHIFDLRRLRLADARAFEPDFARLFRLPRLFENPSVIQITQ